MSLDIINGSVHSLAACTTVVPRVTTSRSSTPSSKKTMGDLYRETERWIERVKTCGYMYCIMWECQWDKTCKTDVEVRGNVDNYSRSAVLNPRDALCGCRCETFALHDKSTYRSMIKYVDV